MDQGAKGQTDCREAKWRERERETNKHKHSRSAFNPEKERHQTLNPKKRPCHRGQSVWLVCASAAQPRPNSCHTWPASPFLCQTQPKRYAFLPVKFCVPFLCCSQCLDSSAVFFFSRSLLGVITHRLHHIDVAGCRCSDCVCRLPGTHQRPTGLCGLCHVYHKCPVPAAGTSPRCCCL